MRSPLIHHRLTRLVLSSFGGLVLACSSVLGISEPTPRASAGSAGAPSEAGRDGAALASGSGAAGEGGSVADAGIGGGAPDGGVTQGGGGASASGASASGASASGAGGMAAQAGGAAEGGSAGSATCVASAKRCAGNEVQHCEQGAWVDEQACDAFCLAGACITPPSCGQLGDWKSCGNSVSCCRALEVPGGHFIRDYDGKQLTSPHYTATVSSFLMERFEVTRARLETFVEAYPDIKLKEGDGRALHIAGDLGWRDSYPLPKSKEELTAELACVDGTWIDPKKEFANFPANCVNFYVAYAFCIWDGGRLPTEAEWNYAAAGGDQQREYPWSVDADDGLDLDHAYYGASAGLPIDVGSKPKGNGRWGHSDLSGNVNEWTLDYYTHVYPSTACQDCVNAGVQPTRATRGGGYKFVGSAQKVGSRTSAQPDTPRSYTGFRCVRDIPPTVQH